MKFKGTIIITDPGYLASGNKFLENTDYWWDETNFGEHLHKLGFTSYLTDNVEYGDCTYFTYKGLEEEIVEKVKEWNCFYSNFISNIRKLEFVDVQSMYDNQRNEFINQNTYGEFCTDSGKICVVYLDEVLKFNPNFKDWVNSHKWCASIIEDFDGDIDLELDEDSLHVVGIGNKNFYTFQS